MCEKISGYKTFAHIFVCHSTRLSEAGFILSTAWHLHRSIADKRVKTVIIFYSQTNQKAEPPRKRRFSLV